MYRVHYFTRLNDGSLFPRIATVSAGNKKQATLKVRKIVAAAWRNKAQAIYTCAQYIGKANNDI